MAALAAWVEARPDAYASTRYLKYAAWVLDFPGAGERAAGARVLRKAFEACGGREDRASALGDFAARFAPRLAEMADDVARGVAVNRMCFLDARRGEA